MIVTRRTSAPPAELDHLVVAAANLAAGIAFVAELTGVTPQPGGKHVAMGTHNALMRLGERAYLEVIAIDPDGATPPRPRWFDLDDVALRGEIWRAAAADPLGRTHAGHRAQRRRLPDRARHDSPDGARRLPLAHDDSR